VKDARDLARHIGAMAPGSTARLAVLQKGQEKTLIVTLGELPREARATPEGRGSGAGTNVPRLGLTLAPANEVAGSGNEGVVVTEVEPNGVAAEHGLKEGDVILEVAGKKVSAPGDVRTAVANAQKDGKRTVLMRVKCRPRRWIEPGGRANCSSPTIWLHPASVARAGSELAEGRWANPAAPRLFQSGGLG
jgi:serine protease Do